MHNIIEYAKDENLEHEIMRWFDRVTCVRVVTEDVLVIVNRSLINRFLVKIYTTHRYPNWQLINRKTFKTSEGVIEYLNTLRRS